MKLKDFIKKRQEFNKTAAGPHGFMESLPGAGAKSFTGGIGVVIGGIMGPTTGAIGQRLADRLMPGPYGAPSILNIAKQNLLESATKGLGGELPGLMGKAIAKSNVRMREKHVYSPARKAIFKDLLKNDPVLGNTAPEEIPQLLKNYHTMARFAPKLSTDSNAVSSFLRNSQMFDEGTVSYDTIKRLAETEKAITEAEKAQE